MKKTKIAALLLSVLLAASTLSACGGGSSSSPAGSEPESAASEASDSAAAESTEAGSEAEAAEPSGDALDIAIVVKGTSSDYWQTVIMGAKRYGEENGAVVTVSDYGPDTESDAGEQVTVLENVIAGQPDAIVIAPTSSEAPVNALKDAMSMGIKVVVIDTPLSTEDYDAFLGTDNYAGGKLAAQMMVDTLKEKNTYAEGAKVAFVAGTAGTKSADDRDSGFMEGLAEYGPDLVLVGPNYSNNVVEQALSIANDFISSEANNGLVGMYANNNLTGGATLVAIRESGMFGELPFVGFDSSDDLIAGMKEGGVFGLVQQDPWGMGYYGIETAVKLCQGESVEREIDTGVTGITPENLDSDEIQGLLDPNKR